MSASLLQAIVLALAVAVFVPMLLESDPKPLGEDVSVKIPPVDEGKFVNRLNEKSKADPAKAAARPEAKPEQPKTDAKSEAAAEPAKAPEPAEPAKSEVAKAEPPKVETPPPAAAAPEPPPKAAAAPSPAPRESASGEFSVQLAAFSDDKGANALANKLKKAGYPAYTEPLSTSRGILWRVRVGPYSSRESAAASREKLKGEGYSGIVAAAK
jgi:DedD protein